MLSATFILSSDPLQDGCFPFARSPPVSSLLQGFKLLPVSGVWWLLWIICAPHPLPAQDQVTLATDVCKVPGARSPGAEPQGTAHSALILPERRGLSSGYPSWQAALSKHGPLCRLSVSVSLSLHLSTHSCLSLLLSCTLRSGRLDLRQVLCWGFAFFKHGKMFPRLAGSHTQCIFAMRWSTLLDKSAIMD